MGRKVGWLNKSIASKKDLSEALSAMERVSRSKKDKTKDIKRPLIEETSFSSECPVCRSVGSCECEEDDRDFTRRVRFEAGVGRVARCPRCLAPLSTIYVRRPGEFEPPYTLSQFTAIWGCANCSSATLMSAAASEGRHGEGA